MCEKKTFPTIVGLLTHFCQLLLALVIIEQCPPASHEDMIEVLLNVFNTRGALMELLKAVVDQEVERSGGYPVHDFRHKYH